MRKKRMTVKMNSGIVDVVKYSPENKIKWDRFVSKSKNGVFLFNRDYMEYHSDRFQDHSLLFFKNGELIGLLPANIRGDELHSHEGLTFGGVITSIDMTAPLMLELFESFINYCKRLNIRKIFYKTIPYIYHLVPSEEDLYALFRYNATLRYRGVSSSVQNNGRVIKYYNYRKKNLQKAIKNGVIVKRSYDFEGFMKMLEEVLRQYHGIKPVHSAEEIILLANRFPEYIKLFSAYKNDVMLAGVIVYESENVAHGQYGANSAEGRELGAEDLVFDYLIKDYYKDKKYFDFGISTEKFGQVLNSGLCTYKEAFGARTVVYDCYQIDL
jgi:hypothetical protein